MNVAELLQGLAGLSWLVAIGAIGFGIFRAARGGGFRGGVMLVAGAVVAAVLLTSVSAGLVFIQPDERGVVISALQPKGYREAALEPGLRWIIPFAENVVLYPISRQTYTMSASTGEGAVSGDDSIRARTNDGQEVFVEASVIYAVDPNEAIDVHIQWQGRYVDELVRPVSRGIIRDVASQYGIEEIVSSKRDELEGTVTAVMERKLTENGLILVDFVLRDIHFSEEYAVAVEQKQIAEQQAQQAAFVVQSKKQEAEQARQEAQGKADAAVIAAKGAAEATVIEAEAQAKALTLVANALRDNPDLITFRYVEKLAPGIQVMLVPNDNPYLLPLPTTNGATVVTPSTPDTTTTP